MIALIVFAGCSSPNQENVSEVLQTKGATALHYDFKKSVENLIVYKEKLDLRNPSNYSKSSQETILK